MSAWVDPRLSPSPPATPQAPAESAEDIEELVRYCRSGRIYAIERWIAEGRPIQADAKGRYQSETPLRIAMATRQLDLALLLLCNGYRTELEPEHPIAAALRLRSPELLEMLLHWGCDPKSLDPEVALQTHNIALIERFREAGLDVTANDALARQLASPTSKPICGWAKRHRDEPKVARALALALVQVIWNRKERAAHLLVWAGADPHRKVPLLEWKQPADEEHGDEEEDVYSAVEMAVERGQGRLMKLLAPDPATDDFSRLYARVGEVETLDWLVRVRPPDDWSDTIRHNVYSITNEFFADRSDDPRWCLERISHHRGRLTSMEPQRVNHLRRDILRMRRTDAQRWLLNWLGDPRNCDPAIWDELVRTPSMQAKIGELGLRGRLQMMRARPSTSRPVART